MKVRLKEQVEKMDGGERRFKQERVEVSNGEFRKVFEATDEPFKVTPDEWPLLRRTGEFEIVEEAAPTEQQNSQQEGQQQSEQGGDGSGASKTGDTSDAPSRRTRQPRTNEK